ncbi:hypothetical protein B0T17DRAFT_405102 [Bombardia bombarda]|uniref:Uncharacterized protein n=1 Tax=Bombardia bombarda TaxID=252184 RepID=A0AA39T278_9PEZI|nr:hypothetical protein B0T17DRAFT_405102 [Bombardia bombarda]
MAVIMDHHRDNNDTTTTDYESGESEAVSFMYSGKKGAEHETVNIQKDKSPKRRTSLKSRRRRSSSGMHCMCFGAELSDHDDSSDSDLEEDDDISRHHHHHHHYICHCHHHGKKVRRPSTHECCHVCECQTTASSHAKGSNGRRKSTASTRKMPDAQKRTPYIEEYPGESTKQRPVILLKEHKLPRRSSASDAKQISDTVEDRMSTSSRKSRSSRGKSSTSAGKQPSRRENKSPPKKRSSSPSSLRTRRHRRSRHSTLDESHEGTLCCCRHCHICSHHKLTACKPDSSRAIVSDVSDHSESESEPPRSPKRQSSTRQRRRSSYNMPPGSDTTAAATVIRSSAWKESASPKYSSSWPLRSGSHIPEHKLQEIHENRRREGYMSDDESDSVLFSHEDNDAFGRHQHRPWAPPTVEPSSPLKRSRQQPKNHMSIRTIVSKPSMAAMSMGRRSTAATELCEIWKGRPDDWESPYSSSDDFEPDMALEAATDESHSVRMLEGSPPRESSASLFSMPSRSRAGLSRGRDLEFLQTRTSSPVRDFSTSFAPSRVGSPSRGRAWDLEFLQTRTSSPVRDSSMGISPSRVSAGRGRAWDLEFLRERKREPSQESSTVFVPIARRRRIYEPELLRTLTASPSQDSSTMISPRRAETRTLTASPSRESSPVSLSSQTGRNNRGFQGTMTSSRPPRRSSTPFPSSSRSRERARTLEFLRTLAATPFPSRGPSPAPWSPPRRQWTQSPDQFVFEPPPPRRRESRSPSPPRRGARAPPARRWTWDYTSGGGFPPPQVPSAPPTSRPVSPVYSSFSSASMRRTREQLLSPTPTRAARFDFDAWGRERGSQSALSLGLV